MKSLLIVAAKGGSGRTTLTCLLACYLQRVSHRRVLVLDLAEPARCARMLGGCGHDAVAVGWYTADLYLPAAQAASGRVHVLGADAAGGLVSPDDPGRVRYYANLRHLLCVAARWFDVCLIDCPPLPDLRAVCAEALADAVLGPVTVSPGCIEYAAELINGTYGIRNVRARLNPPLRFLGLLPVITSRTPFEQAWAKVMETTLREWLVPDRQFPQGYLCLPYLEAIGRVQERTAGGTHWAAHGTALCEGACAALACLSELTSRIEAIRGDAEPATCDPEVCDA